MYNKQRKRSECKCEVVRQKEHSNTLYKNPLSHESGLIICIAETRFSSEA